MEDIRRLEEETKRELDKVGRVGVVSGTVGGAYGDSLHDFWIHSENPLVQEVHSSKICVIPNPECTNFELYTLCKKLELFW